MNKRPPTSKVIIQTYKDTDKQWRWRFCRRAFGKMLTIADSGEAYENKEDMEETLSNLIVSIQIGNFVRPRHLGPALFLERDAQGAA